MKNTQNMPITTTIDLIKNEITKGTISYTELVEECLKATDLPNAANVFTKKYSESALSSARCTDSQIKSGVSLHPLAGLPITIKDLYDVKDETTESATKVLRGGAPAKSDAEIVKRIRNAGMAILGKTNMSEFAFSGVGINPHWGTPQNPSDALEHRVPGGSSSGAAVSVALGLCVAAIGSDTGGSIRVPAALCGLVGFKSSMFRVPIQGAVELARSLDTVCAMTRSVKDSLLIDALLSGEALNVKPRSVAGMRLAVSKTLLQDNLEPQVAKTFEKSIALLSKNGAQIIEIDLKEFAEISQINAPGGLASIESYAAYEQFVESAADQMDSRVVKRMLLGKGVTAAQYIKLLDARKAWIKRVESILRPFDALLSPTVPLQAPKTQGLLDSEEEFFRVNGLLLRNTSAINFLDGCSFSLPMQAPGELPMGLMLSHCNAEDANLASVALAVEAVLKNSGGEW